MTDRDSPFLRRHKMARSALLAAAATALGAESPARAVSATASDGYFNLRDFGATGDGKTDDTRAIQRALDAAGEVQGAVFVPPGVYLCADLRMRPHTALVGEATWNYQVPGGTVLQLSTGAAKCLLDIGGATGVVIDGLAFEGGSLGNAVHGIFLDKPDKGDLEDAIRIERCRVTYFTGDGVKLRRAWVYSVRHSMLGFNGGDGLNLRGWDGFVTDNWFALNNGAGFAAREDNSSCTFTANRIEWNNQENMLIMGGKGYQITGNLFDYAGTRGLALRNDGRLRCSHMTITGNFFRGNGKYADPATHDSCHIFIEGADGVTCVGNDFQAKYDEYYGTSWSPGHGIVCKDLQNSVIANNVLHEGATQQLIVDQGGHAEGVVLRDNPGSLFKVSSDRKPSS